jgi:hypothetical protein
LTARLWEVLTEEGWNMNGGALRRKRRINIGMEKIT